MTSRRWMPIATACAAILALATTGRAQSRPATAAKPLARYVPATDLIFYAEFEGLDAHAAGWKKTALAKLLNETKLGAMVDDLFSQVIDQMLASSNDKDKPTKAELAAMWKGVLRDGFACGFAGKPGNGNDTSFVFVFRNGARNGILDYIKRADAASDQKSKAERRGSRTIYTGQGSPTYWAEGDDLVLAKIGGQIDPVLAVIDGKAPNAATHAVRNELLKKEADFEPAAILFVDFAKLPPPPDAAKYGIDGLKRIDYRVGFQDEALFSVFRVIAPAPRRGALALFEAPAFDKNALPPIPAGLTSWTVFSFTPASFYEKLKGLAAIGGPMGAQQYDAFEQGIQQNLGIRVKEDFLGQLGPKWVFYVNGEAPPPGQPIGKVRAALTAEVRDPATFARTVDKVMAVVTQVLQGQAAQNPQARMPQLQKVAGPTPGYRLVLPQGTIPPQVAGIIDPTILIGKKQFVLALNGAEARAAVAGGKTWTPGPEYQVPFSKLPNNLIALGVDDPRAVLPELISNAPSLVAMINATALAQPARGPAGPRPQLKLDPSKVPTAAEVSRHLFPNTMAVTLDRQGLTVTSRESVPSMTGIGGMGVGTALLLPAVQAAREAARRSQCVNNLKQIGLALHNFHSATDGFPAAAITGKDGKPLLSWRVAILPYIEQQSLYNQFHLNEPWDSPHNKTLIAKMPQTYACPSRARVEPGTTTYKALVGGGALFDATKPVSMRQVTDGTSNTMAVIEGKTPVVWTKPDDIPFDPRAKPSLLDAGSNHSGGFNVLFTDGSVRFIKTSINVITFQALITRAGGEVVAADAF